MLTQKQLKERFFYDPDTGIFTHKLKSSSRAIGSIAGRINHDGYHQLSVNKKLYQASRCAWLYVYGSFPLHQVDHINRNKSDNRIVNLRELTPKENRQNTGISKANKSGFIGVVWNRSAKKWQAQISINQKNTGREREKR